MQSNLIQLVAHANYNKKYRTNKKKEKKNDISEETLHLHINIKSIHKTTGIDKKS